MSILTLQSDDPDDPEIARLKLAGMDIASEIAQTRALLIRAEYRDEIAGDRPPGCWCLGIGGGGPVPSNYHPGPCLRGSGGTCWCHASANPPHTRSALTTRPSTILWINGGLYFERWCSCDEAIRLQEEQRNHNQRELAARANEAQARLDQARALAIKDSGLTDKQRAYRLGDWENTKYNPHTIANADTFIKAGEVHGCPGLYLSGEPRIGKTALAACIVKAWINACSEMDDHRDGHSLELAPRGRAVFIDVPSFLRRIRSSFNADPPNTEQITACAYQPGLLVLDDFGAEYQTPWVRATLFEIVNYRCQRRLPTVFTSNYSLETLALRLAVDSESTEVGRLTGRICELAALVPVDGEDLSAP